MYKLKVKKRLDKEYFGSTIAISDDASTMLVSSILENDRGRVFVFELQDNEYHMTTIYEPPDTKKVATALCVVGSEFYFTQIVNETLGQIVRFSKNEFVVICEISDVGECFGINDTSISVSGDTIAVSDFTIETLYYYYHTKIHIIKNGTVVQTIDTDPYNPDSRTAMARSLILANDGSELLAGSPDFRFTEDDTRRTYVGNRSSILRFTLSDGQYVYDSSIISPERSNGNFFGTEMCANDSTLIVMSPGENDGTGCAYLYGRVDNEWLLSDKLQPRKFKVQTKMKLSLYGRAISQDGKQIYLGDSLAGKVYQYQYNDSWELTNTFSRKDSRHQLFGQEITLSADGRFLAIVCAHEDDGTVYIVQTR